jgi:hypothetical protein
VYYIQLPLSLEGRNVELGNKSSVSRTEQLSLDRHAWQISAVPADNFGTHIKLNLKKRKKNFFNRKKTLFIEPELYFLNKNF